MIASTEPLPLNNACCWSCNGMYKSTPSKKSSLGKKEIPMRVLFKRGGATLERSDGIIHLITDKPKVTTAIVRL